MSRNHIKVLSKKENRDEQVILRDLYQDKEFLRCRPILKENEERIVYIYCVCIYLWFSISDPGLSSLVWTKTKTSKVSSKRVSSSSQRGSTAHLVPLHFFPGLTSGETRSRCMWRRESGWQGGCRWWRTQRRGWREAPTRQHFSQ